MAPLICDIVKTNVDRPEASDREEGKHKRADHNLKARECIYTLFGE